MGFRPEPNIYRLKFQDPNMKGLEVDMESLSVDEFSRIQELAAEAQQNAENPKPGGTTSTDMMLNSFSENLVRWNLEDKHGPVPANRQGVGTQKFDLILGIIMAWMTSIAGVDDETGKDSSSGGISEELSLGMASSSQSLQNWPEPT
jgi:hypothetical protein